MKTSNIRLMELRPKVFVAENVASMSRGVMVGKFNEIFKRLLVTGYMVTARILNAKNFGVPQSRERLIFIGVDKKIGKKPVFPHYSNRLKTLKSCLSGVKSKTIMPCGEKMARKWAQIKPGKGYNSVTPGQGFNTKKLSWDKLSPTVLKTVGDNYAGLLHPDEPRFMSIEELKRIHTFPDNYRFIGKFEEQWARIGNSVPPEMMRRIALTIRKEILKKVNT